MAEVARKVINAVSRVRASAMALARLPPIAPSKASPASVVTKVRGRTMNKLARVTPKMPTVTYRRPHTRPAM
ncbi:hypothetical protein D3C72_2176940 [compost metagenome]